jgi:integrase/recombinase XerD
VDGILAGVELRESLKMRDWQRAQDTARAWEAENRRVVESEPRTINAAWVEFLADIEARKLADSTIRKYKLLNRKMEDFAKERGFRFLNEFDLTAVSQFRAGWKDGPRSSAKKLERLRAFFRFAQKRKWTQDNPASDLQAPKVTLGPTMPFTHAEMLRILSAIDTYKDEFPGRGAENARRIRALVLLLRYSGMRFGDAVSLTADRIEGHRLFLYTQKTGVPVNTVLPDFVLKALDATPRVTDKHFFWDGGLKLETVVGSWRKRLVRLFELAKVENGHAHRFRDTFAVELLLTGVPIERVSVLLGHQSVRITERHYAPWVRSRQEQLEADLVNAWSCDPVIAAQTGGTPQVHEKKQRSNSHILKRKNWRRGWDSNPRMEVLQTSPLGHLGTAPNL